MLPTHSHLPGDCRLVADILSRVGDKWSVLIVMLLGKGRKHFSELERSIGGISKRMLSLTLRRLERDGIVRRTVFDTNPPTVDYELTDAGRSLWTPIEAFGQWVIDNQAQIEMCRKVFDEAQSDRIRR